MTVETRFDRLPDTMRTGNPDDTGMTIYRTIIPEKSLITNPDFQGEVFESGWKGFNGKPIWVEHQPYQVGSVTDVEMVPGKGLCAILHIYPVNDVHDSIKNTLREVRRQILSNSLCEVSVSYRVRRGSDGKPVLFIAREVSLTLKGKLPVGPHELVMCSEGTLEGEGHLELPPEGPKSPVAPEREAPPAPEKGIAPPEGSPPEKKDAVPVGGEAKEVKEPPREEKTPPEEEKGGGPPAKNTPIEETGGPSGTHSPQAETAPAEKKESSFIFHRETPPASPPPEPKEMDPSASKANATPAPPSQPAQQPPPQQQTQQTRQPPQQSPPQSPPVQQQPQAHPPMHKQQQQERNGSSQQPPASQDERKEDEDEMMIDAAINEAKTGDDPVTRMISDIMGIKPEDVAKMSEEMRSRILELANALNTERESREKKEKELAELAETNRQIQTTQIEACSALESILPKKMRPANGKPENVAHLVKTYTQSLKDTVLTLKRNRDADSIFAGVQKHFHTQTNNHQETHPQQSSSSSPQHHSSGDQANTEVMAYSQNAGNASGQHMEKRARHTPQIFTIGNLRKFFPEEMDTFLDPSLQECVSSLNDILTGNQMQLVQNSASQQRRFPKVMLEEVSHLGLNMSFSEKNRWMLLEPDTKKGGVVSKRGKA